MARGTLCWESAITIIATHGLTKRYGTRTGVESIELNVPSGTIFGFLGPNGAGKTTAIRLMLGFLRPTEGQASIFGLDCWKQSHLIKREVGYISGDVRLYPWLTVERALALLKGIHGHHVLKRGLELVERLQLDDNVPVRKMSRGMRQKLALVMAMAHKPKLLVLDEPTSGLDPLMQLELASILREQAKNGSTIFFSSHTLSEVEQLCERVAIVRAGRIVADESLDALRERARREVMVRFTDEKAATGSPVPEAITNLRREGDTWRFEIEGAAAPLRPWLATQSVRDFTVGPPDLETIFHSYYQQEQG